MYTEKHTEEWKLAQQTVTDAVKNGGMENVDQCGCGSGKYNNVFIYTPSRSYSPNQTIFVHSLPIKQPAKKH